MDKDEAMTTVRNVAGYLLGSIHFSYDAFRPEFRFFVSGEGVAPSPGNLCLKRAGEKYRVGKDFIFLA